MVRSFLVASAAALACVAPALAVECPAEQRGVFVHPTAPSEPRGVTEETIATIDLGAHQQPGRLLRTRKLTIAPGGVIAWHNHTTRPALTYVVAGEMTEVRATCGAPLVYRTGDVVVEDESVAHWWRNDAAHEAVLIATDIVIAAR